MEAEDQGLLPLKKRNKEKKGGKYPEMIAELKTQ